MARHVRTVPCDVVESRVAVRTRVVWCAVGAGLRNGALGFSSCTVEREMACVRRGEAWRRDWGNGRPLRRASV